MTVDKSWCHGLTAAATSLTPDLSRTRRSGRPDSATDSTCPQSLYTRTYAQALDWISEAGYLLRQTANPVTLAGKESCQFFRDMVHRLMVCLAREVNLLHADGFPLDPYRCGK